MASNRKRATASWEKRKAQYEAKTGKPFFEELEGWPLFRVRITSFGVEDPYGEEDPRPPAAGGPQPAWADGARRSHLELVF